MTRQWLVAALLLAGCGGSVSDGAGGGGQGGTGGSGGFICVGAHWRRVGPRSDAQPRYDHYSGAWQSNEILVWGGISGETSPDLADGWRVSDDGLLSAFPTEGAPSGRVGAAFVVVGNQLLVWGGQSGPGLWPDGGAQLDLIEDRWSPMTTVDQPEARYQVVAGIASQQLLIWGGFDQSGQKLPDGALYNPNSVAWFSLAEDALELHTANTRTVQAGEYVAVLKPPYDVSEQKAPAKLYLFHPADQKWHLASSVGAPTSRERAVVVYLPDTQELLIWGGYDWGSSPGSDANDGARYSIANDTWQTINTTGAPSPRDDASAVVLSDAKGTKVLVWGGFVGTEPSASGGIYDATTDTWEPIPDDQCAPPALSRFTLTAFGHGHSALLWGGAKPDTVDLIPEQGWIYTLSP